MIETVELFIPIKRCDLCGSEKLKNFPYAKTVWEGYEFTIKKCRNCELLSIGPRPTKNTLKKLYSSEYFEKGDWGAPSKQMSYFDENANPRRQYTELCEAYSAFCSEVGINGGKLLEIGCAGGILLDEFKKRGWEPYGVDVSSEAIKFARERYHLSNTFVGELEDCKFPDNFFDLIVAKHTLEHIPSPSKLLQECHRILKPGGLVLIHTGTELDSIYNRLKLLMFIFRSKKRFKTIFPFFQVPYHCYMFTQRTLGEYMRRNNFKVVKIYGVDWMPSRTFWDLKKREYKSHLIVYFHQALMRMLVGISKSLNKGQMTTIIGKKVES